MKRDKLEQWAHEHAEDIEIMYHEHGLIGLGDVVTEGKKRRAVRRALLIEQP